MKRVLFVCIFALIGCLCFLVGQINKGKESMEKYNELTPFEKSVIIDKGTEAPFSGDLLNNKEKGTYVCKQCNAPLYRSESKFESNCGWPSFDDEIEGAVRRQTDRDGRRVEIICANCEGHLGHVFMDEGFTPKNTRHCVNSVSMKFIPDEQKLLSKAYFASGCFWGTEYYFQKLGGISKTEVGYMGGDVDNPSYEDVCTGTTGHLETIEVEYNPENVTYEQLVKYFFETHDFTQTNGQGPDIGLQYLSCIFYADEEQKAMAEKYIKILEKKGYHVATMLKPVSVFWKAEGYHQQYYEHTGKMPYCHKYTQIF